MATLANRITIDGEDFAKVAYLESVGVKVPTDNSSGQVEVVSGLRDCDGKSLEIGDAVYIRESSFTKDDLNLLGLTPENRHATLVETAFTTPLLRLRFTHVVQPSANNQGWYVKPEHVRKAH